ncbi:MAG: tripartite tricarboxylate transporter substrate binding protein [Pseudomonadota bacterium]
MNLKSILAASVCVLAALPFASSAQSIPYPDRPITWVVPFPAGNVTDAFSRLVAQALTKKLGQSIVVENRTGAGGIIGTQAVANAKPDGYTMLYGSSGPIATYVSLYKKLPYVPLQSFVPVNGLAANPLILVVNASKPYKTVEEFVAYLKKNPGTVNFGSPGVGTGSHLTGELFQMATGTTMTHVPYKESGGLYSDLRAGRIDAIFDFIPVMRPHLNAGTVLALGVSRETRVKSFPNIPTFKEKGYDLVLASWSSILMPAGTPVDIVQKMSAAIQEVMKLPEIVKFQEENDQMPLSTLGPNQLREFIVKETEVYRILVKKSGASVD